MNEDRRDLEEHETRKEFQMRIPDSRLQWIHVQQLVSLVHNFFPSKWIIRRRCAVEDRELVGSLLCNMVAGDEY